MSRRPSRVADASRQYPADSVQPVFIPSVPSAWRSSLLRFGWVMPLYVYSGSEYHS